MKFLVVLPTYNEAGNISVVLRQIAENVPNIDILHIDDSSPDGTAEIATEMKLEKYRQIRNLNKQGLGKTYVQSFKWAITHKYDYVLTMDADGSHHPEQIPDFIDRVSNFDLVIGSRWLPGGLIENWPWYRRLLSKVGTIYASRSLDLPYSDLTSGFRLYRVEELAKLDLAEIQSHGYSFQIEMAAKLHKSGAKIREIPIIFTERTRGRSKMTFGIAIEAFLWCTKARFKGI